MLKSSACKSEKSVEENVEAMNSEERELIEKKIVAASNVACTLIYADGSTLLRPATTNSPVSMLGSARR